MSRRSAVAHRLYADFLLPDRLEDYRGLLARARRRGYALLSLSAYRAATGSGYRPARVLVLRRDVDTDPGTAAAMFAVEQELGARASYFFRLGTVAPELMRRVAAAGGDVGYHFEELSTVAKERRVRDAAAVERHLPEIRARFAANLLGLRARTGLPLTLVAAHGDMANRRLGVSNRVLLDADLRARLGIEGEAYDPEFRAGVTARFSDAPYPAFWRPDDPARAVDRGEPVISTLTHPRHWRRNVAANLRDDLGRMGDELRYRLPARR